MSNCFKKNTVRCLRWQFIKFVLNNLHKDNKKLKNEENVVYIYLNYVDTSLKYC